MCSSIGYEQRTVTYPKGENMANERLTEDMVDELLRD